MLHIVIYILDDCTQMPQLPQVDTDEVVAPQGYLSICYVP